MSPRNIFLFILVQVAFTTSALSQQNPDSVAYSIDLQQYVITGQHKPTHYKNALHHVQVITAEDVEKRGMTQLDELLRQNSNVRINYDPILGATIKLRGISGENVSILKDGVPVIGRLDGNIDLSQISLDNIERVEIIEGPQSVLYGNNASGGIINLVSKKSQLDLVKITASSNIQLPLVQQHKVSVGIKLPKFIIQLGGTYLDDSPFLVDSLRVFESVSLSEELSIQRKKYPWNPKERMTSYASLRYFINDENSITAKFDRMDEDIVNYGPVRRPTYKPYAFDEYYTTSRKDYSLHYNGMINGLNSNAIFAYNQYQRDKENQRYEFEELSNNEEFYILESSSFNSIFAKLDLSKKVNKWSYLIGSQFNLDMGSGDRVLDINSQDTTLVSSREFSLFGDVKYQLSKKLESSASTRMTIHSNYGIQLSPSWQSLWKISDKWSARAGFARGFRSPSLKELYINFIDVNHFILGSPDLQPEQTNDWNLSLDFEDKWQKVDVSARFQLYRTKTFNKIILAEYEPAKYQYLNLENFTSQGLNLDFQVNFRSWNLSNSSSQSFWFNIHSSEVDSPKYLPVFDNVATLSYQPRKFNYQIFLTHRYVGKVPRYFLDQDQLKQSITEGFHMVDLGWSTSLLKEKLQLQIGLRNALNVIYANTTQSNNAANHASETISSNQLVGRGRTAYVQLQYVFSTSKKN